MEGTDDGEASNVHRLVFWGSGHFNDVFADHLLPTQSKCSLPLLSVTPAEQNLEWRLVCGIGFSTSDQRDKTFVVGKPLPHSPLYS